MKTDLLYADGAAWKPLPPWARFFIALGGSAGGCDPAEGRLVLAAIAPTRAYAAALTALGVVTARAVGTTVEADLGEHLRRIRSLPSGASVFLIENGRKHKGIFLGVASVSDGRELIKVQVEPLPAERKSGGCIRWLPLSAAPSIRVAEEAFGELPKRQDGRPVIENASFVRHALAGIDVNEFALRPSDDCSVIGTVSKLKFEITETTLSVSDHGQPGAKGTLGDVLRVRQFQRDGEPHRTEVMKSAVDRERSETVLPDQPRVAVFDGPSAFLHRRNTFRHSHWVIILDQLDPDLAEAAGVFNAGYIQDRSSGNAGDGLPGPPPGVEVAAYRERKG